jgi:hypothetical protein
MMGWNVSRKKWKHEEFVLGVLVVVTRGCFFESMRHSMIFYELLGSTSLIDTLCFVIVLWYFDRSNWL